MPDRNFDEFMALYNPDGTHPVTEVSAPADAERDTSPFIVVRSGQYTVLINPLPQPGPDGYLDIDLHSFINGERVTASVLGMTTGRRHTGFTHTGFTSAGAPSVSTVIVLVGEQGTASLHDGDAIRVTGGDWKGRTGRVEHVNKTGSCQVRLDTSVPGQPGKLVTVPRLLAEPAGH
jgi:hypothetical protein